MVLCSAFLGVWGEAGYRRHYKCTQVGTVVDDVIYMWALQIKLSSERLYPEALLGSACPFYVHAGCLRPALHTC